MPADVGHQNNNLALPESPPQLLRRRFVVELAANDPASHRGTELDSLLRASQTRFPIPDSWFAIAFRRGHSITKSLEIGKYVVSPLTRASNDGRYTAGVSIRCGTGSMTHDRVVRFIPIFDTPEEAARYATRQAFAWIEDSSSDFDIATPRRH